MHPLDGAREQVYGAREHLDLLRPEIKDFTKVVSNRVSLQYQKGVVNIGGKIREVPIGSLRAPSNLPAPPRTARLIGEVVQNLRVALDFLIYEMACFDSKSIVEKSQFVIVDSPEEFKGQLWHLRGMSADHIAAIERLQPYKGTNWTKLLRDLSNPSKHRLLTIVKHPVIVTVHNENTERILAGEHVDVNDYASIKITFDNGPPVIEGLEQLISDVAHTLDAFQHEF